MTSDPLSADSDRPSNGLSAIDELRVCLLREYMALKDFVDFLKGELKDIADFDAEKLIGSTAAKERRLMLLDTLDRQRGQLLSRIGVPASAAGMETLLRDRPAFAGTMRKVWEGILATSVQARHLNETNGRLIANQLAFCESRMSALVRFARPDATYGADGRRQAQPWSLANTRA